MIYSDCKLCQGIQRNNPFRDEPISNNYAQFHADMWDRGEIVRTKPNPSNLDSVYGVPCRAWVLHMSTRNEGAMQDKGI